MAGPSLGVLDDQLFITLGLYFGKRIDLSGALFESAPIPNDLKDIAVHRSEPIVLGLSLSWTLTK